MRRAFAAHACLPVRGGSSVSLQAYLLKTGQNFCPSFFSTIGTSAQLVLTGSCISIA